MKKQACYLPNLNSLFMQNKSYQSHRSKIKEARSALESYNTEESCSKKEIIKLQDILTKLAYSETISPVRKASDHPQIQHQLYQITERLKQSPFQRRKTSQKERQNSRLRKALNKSNPTIDRYNKKNQQAYEAMKSRMSKYTRDGSKVSYKYKKSLLEIEKRRREKTVVETERSLSLQNDTRQRLQAMIKQTQVRLQKTIESKQPRKKHNHSINDIYFPAQSQQLKKDQNSKSSQLFESLNTRINRIRANKIRLKVIQKPQKTSQDLQSISKMMLMKHVEKLRVYKQFNKEKEQHQRLNSEIKIQPSNKKKHQTPKLQDIQIVQIYPEGGVEVEKANSLTNIQ